MSSFWLLLKQQWTIEEISIFSNISHLERRVDLSDTILKETHPRTIPARFGLIRFRGFRGEHLNVKVYDVRRTNWRWQTTDAKWWQKLKIYIPFIYAKFWICTLPFIYFSRYKTAKSLKNENIKNYILEISLFYNNSNYAGY